MSQHPIFVELEQAWNKRELKEKRVFLGLGVVVLLALIYLIAVEPAVRGIREIEKNLPTLREQEALMKSMSEQYGVIAQAMSQNIPPVTREFVESSLARRNIKTQSLNVANDIVRIQSNNANYAQVMEWILEMQKVARLSVDEAKLSALDEAGQVGVVLSLRQQKINNQ